MRGMQGKHHLESLASLDRLMPPFETFLQNFGVMYRLASPTFHLVRTSTSVLIPTLVVPKYVAVRMCHPAQFGD